MKRLLLCTVLALVALGELHAQSRVGTTAAPFLTLGTGARGQALGHAYTATVVGADALFWNPAAAAKRYQDVHLGGVFATHADWFADIDYNAAGVAIPVSRTAVVGLSLAQVAYGDMKVRTVDQPEGTGENFSASDFSLGLSYAQPLTPFFYFGGTARYVRQSIRDMAASTVAFDFGFLLATEYLNGLRVGASIQNFGGTMMMEGINAEIKTDIDPNNSGSSSSIPANLKTDQWDLPLLFKFGIAWPVFDVNGVSFTAMADAQQTNDQNLNADFGGELRYQTRFLTFDLRGGYRDAFLGDDVEQHLSYGSGIDLRIQGVRVGFDYAFVPAERLGDVQILDMRIYF